MPRRKPQSKRDRAIVELSDELNSQCPGSFPLQNERQELFCQYIVQGKTAYKAFLDAGYCGAKESNARANSTRLRANKHVRDRIEWLRFEQSLIHEAETHRIIYELKQIAYSNVDNFLESRNGEIVLRDFSKISYINKKAISKLRCKTTTNSNGDTTVDQEIILHDKLSALNQLSTLTGMKTDFSKIRVWLRSKGYDLVNDMGELNLIKLQDVE